MFVNNLNGLTFDQLIQNCDLDDDEDILLPPTMNYEQGEDGLGVLNGEIPRENYNTEEGCSCSNKITINGMEFEDDDDILDLPKVSYR